MIGQEQATVGGAGEPEGFLAERAGRERRVAGPIGREAHEPVGDGEEGIVGQNHEVAQPGAVDETEFAAERLGERRIEGAGGGEAEGHHAVGGGAAHAGGKEIAHEDGAVTALEGHGANLAGGEAGGQAGRERGVERTGGGEAGHAHAGRAVDRREVAGEVNQTGGVDHGRAKDIGTGRDGCRGEAAIEAAVRIEAVDMGGRGPEGGRGGVRVQVVDGRDNDFAVRLAGDEPNAAREERRRKRRGGVERTGGRHPDHRIGIAGRDGHEEFAIGLDDDVAGAAVAGVEAEGRIVGAGGLIEPGQGADDFAVGHVRVAIIDGPRDVNLAGAVVHGARGGLLVGDFGELLPEDGVGHGDRKDGRLAGDGIGAVANHDRVGRGGGGADPRERERGGRGAGDRAGVFPPLIRQGRTGNGRGRGDGQLHRGAGRNPPGDGLVHDRHG